MLGTLLQIVIALQIVPWKFRVDHTSEVVRIALALAFRMNDRSSPRLLLELVSMSQRFLSDMFVWMIKIGTWKTSIADWTRVSHSRPTSIRVEGSSGRILL